ncbi:MAG: TfuA-like protein [Chthoniobacterales bacterium]
MSVYVFTGPTLSVREATNELEAVYLSPAAEGDIYRVTLRDPQAIGIIDGYFQSRPTVRHKEILWAMSRGVHVFGSASIGALRAAELASFGMNGVGHIFELYRDRVLEDDDEVAIAHGGAETGFLALSEAMVNIRATLHKAELSGVISPRVSVALQRIGKHLFYPDRNYPLLLRSAMKARLPKSQLARFRQWLPANRVNQKRKDAVAMLRVMRRRLRAGLKPKKISYCFEHTSTWDTAWRQCGGEIRFRLDTEPGTFDLESLLDEVRLAGNLYHEQTLIALERFFAIREAHRIGMKVTSVLRKRTEIAFRRERGLIGDAEFQGWMRVNDFGRNDFDAVLDDEARVRWVHQLAQFVSVTRLPEQLRLSGDYPKLLARALAKGRWLESSGLTNPSLEDAGLTESQLLHWYFQAVLGRKFPNDRDECAHALGYASSHALRRALIKEYLYRRAEEQEKADRPNDVRNIAPLT